MSKLLSYIPSFIIGSIILLYGCAQNVETIKVEDVRPVKNKAIDMAVPQTAESVPSLYGMSLGESKLDVEEKYRLIACRKDAYFDRCAASLDIVSSKGVLNGDTAMVFIAFKQDAIDSMRVVLSETGAKYSRAELQQYYGVPTSEDENEASWDLSSGVIILSKKNRNNTPPVLQLVSE